MSDIQEDPSSSGKTRRETKAVAETFSVAVTLTGLIAAILSIITFLLNYGSLFPELSELPSEFLSIIAIVITILVVLSLSFFTAIKFSQWRSLQTKTATEKLKSKEARLFQDIEAELSALLNDKVN